MKNLIFGGAMGCCVITFAQAARDNNWFFMGWATLVIIGMCYYTIKEMRNE